MADELEGRTATGARRARTPKAGAPKPAAPKIRRKGETPTLTDDLTGKFIRVGDKLYRTSDDRTPIARLDPDRLRTSNIDALPDIIRIAKANGWTSIRINGGDTFKKAAFLAAAAQGLTVENYTASKLVQAEADRLQARIAAREKRRADRKPDDTPSKATKETAALKALAERFLRQTHEENARDPELRRAQTIVAQTIAITRAKYPGEPAAAAKEIDARRQDVARRIASGDKIAVIQVRNQQAQRVREITQDQALKREGRAR